LNYNKLTDGDFSVLVAGLLKPKYKARVNRYNKNAAELVWDWYGKEQTTGFCPLIKADESFTAIKQNRIGIIPEGKTTWKAIHESGISATHKNPLRAALTVLLMLKGVTNDQPNPQ